MTITRAVELARTVREDLLRTRGRDCTLKGHCGLASIRLAVELGDPSSIRLGFFMRQERFMGKHGRYPHCHAWNVVGDHIVDITATQFGRYPAIYVVPARDALPYLETADGPQALKEMAREWHLDCIDEYEEPLRAFRSLSATPRSLGLRRRA